jgi:hypothetical protein
VERTEIEFEIEVKASRLKESIENKGRNKDPQKYSTAQL